MHHITVDIQNWLEREETIKKRLASNLSSFVDNVSQKTRLFAMAKTPVGYPITPGGDRPRPGHTYGDLRNGWLVAHVKNATANGNNRYEGGVTHDAVQDDYSTGFTILNVLESGATGHDIAARRFPTLTYFDTRADMLVFPIRVHHPGAEPRQLLTRVRAFANTYIQWQNRKIMEGVK